MVKRKAKPQRAVRDRVDSCHAEDIPVNTGLPPQVEGQLRCFCRLSVTQVTWTVPNTPDLTHVRMKWWGEPGDGLLFRPMDMKRRNNRECKTTARYPVRSGPKQFTSYLNDMNSLVLDVLGGQALVPVGTVEVPHIGQVAPNRPINGSFPIMSPTEEKIGELHVSLMIESLMASYDSTGSIPTTDLSMETYTSHVTQESTYPKQSHPVPHSDQPRKPEEDPFISPASHQNAETRLVNGYTDDLRQKLQYEPDSRHRRYQPIENGSTVAITTNGDVIKTNMNNDVSMHERESLSAVPPPRPAPVAPAASGNGDLLSVLLDRGNKLREQMIVSTLDSKSKSPGRDPLPNTTSVGATGGGKGNDPDVSVRSSDGSFLRELLRAEKLHGHPVDDDNIEETAVDLVFGGQMIDDIRLLKSLHAGSPTQSISGDDDIVSDHEDPIHSESILNELFYKNPASSDGLSDLSDDETKLKLRHQLEDDSNMRPPSRSSSVSSLNLAFPEPEKKKPPKIARTPKRKSRLKLKRKGSGKKRRQSQSRASASECSDSDALSTVSTPRSESSRVSFDMVPSDIDEPPTKDENRHKKKSNTVDGLSVERLTLLGRVHVARVTIELLQLIGQELDTSKSSKSKSKTKYGVKPPRPSPKAKKSCTYFIEYQFPVVATSRDKYSPNTMATEVMRVVSRNVKNGVVTFNHRSVFPVMFDGTAVERWWKSALIFKVYSRTAGQKVPSLIGSCGIPLKSLLKSESLHIGRDLDVRQADKTGNVSLNGSKVGPDGLLGSLKLVIELASDNKEFPTALAKTKLAEMTGKAKIVPIAQSQPAAPKPPVPPESNQKVSVIEPASGAPRGLESAGRSRTPERARVRTPERGRSRTPVSQMVDQLPIDAALSMPQPVSVQHYEGDQTILQYPSNSQQQGEALTLHTVLLIPDGCNISMQGIPSLLSTKRRPVFPQPSAHSAPGVRARDLSVRNTYLVCRMFWCDESVHSSVCWGTSEPQFKFQQVAPVLMSQSLLERLKNNFMIVEVWDKKTSADNDKLVGIVKLSLHQFYMSFRDKRISSALLKSQYPVIAVENYLPVVDPFSGSQYGQLNILLAMGSAEQVAHLVRMKTEGAVAISAPHRPQHFLERQDLLNQGETIPAQIGTECIVEHVFEIVVEGIRGLSLFDNMIWGEADCFVQYHFPTQQQTNPPGAPVIRHAVPTMKAFRTATTLCVADPTFNDVTRHRVLLPQGTPVQRELLTACANTGGGAGGLPFEIWCRYYHPNVRDQCIAKSSLPLAKLCAMITMQKRGEPSVQTFSFPLTHVPSDQNNDEAKPKSRDAGLMDVTIHYKSQVIQNETSIAAANKNLTGAQVCISVGVIRCCGLKIAAERAARLDEGMQYPAEVGVNSYVRVRLSFLGKEGERITRTIARTFTPEFSHFMDFPCPLLWTEPDSDALCLAEILETGEAIFEVWHQVPGLSFDLDQQLNALSADNGVSGRQLIQKKTQDVMLGSVTLPVVGLLSHRTGISGWFPVNIPVTGWSKDERAESQDPADESQNQQGLHRVGGGLELSIKFAHHEDRERVVHAARGVGWSPVDVDVEQDDWESEDEDSNRFHHVNITIDHVSFPVQNALIAGQNTLDKTAKCYVRYKFYDKAAVMTKFASVSVNSKGYITSQPRNKHDLQIPDSSTFKWYLREEKLEVQVWISYGSRPEEPQRPKHRDRLIGTAYISMETLGDQRRKQHRVSGMYPLYKPGATSLGGGYIRAHIAAKPQFGRIEQDRQEGIITLDGEEVEFDPDDSFHQILSHKPDPPRSPAKSEPQPAMQAPDTDKQDKKDTFGVMIQVERALHLPHITDKQTCEDHLPNTYVAYSTAESTIQSYTNVFHNSDNPVWDHEHETKLSTEMLEQENKHLVFKVWHKPSGAPKSPDKLTDRVLGFVSVDLTPLASGMLQISGWYNIMDFSGQVKGQIKINVIPQDSVISTGTGSDNRLSDPVFHPPSSSFLSLPPLGIQGAPVSQGPISLPSYDSPHLQYHYDQVKQHHELLQEQLREHIQQFLRQQEESQGSGGGMSGGSGSQPGVGGSDVTNVTQGITNAISSVADPSGWTRETSIHWRPTIPDLKQDDSSSRSYLFTNLRRNLQDLDDITSNLKAKLTMKSSASTQSQLEASSRLPEFDIPVTSQSGQYPLTSTHSSILSFELPRSQRETPRDDLAFTGSHGGDSSRTAGDSGAFTMDHSNEKYDESGQTSHRSDKMDTLRSGATPRELLALMENIQGMSDNSNNSNVNELGLAMGRSLSPQESVERKDIYSESGGFSYGVSPRTPLHTPREVKASPRDVAKVSSLNRTDDSHHTATGVSKEVMEAEKEDQKQMSVIQEFPEGDGSDSEEDEENKYYHRYRDLLNSDDEDAGDKSEGDDDGEVVVPRRINDVSGKFSPSREIPVVDKVPSKSVPYETISYKSDKQTDQNAECDEKSDTSSRSLKEKHVDILEDIEYESDKEMVPRNKVHMAEQEQILFEEKDSWLSDSDKENEDEHVNMGYQFLHNHGHLPKHRPQRQDSDTGYSSRDNVSESYLTPSAGGTNSETDMSRLHEHEHWEHRDSDEHVFVERPKNKLLANVELESTGGSFGLKYDVASHSRLSSAGSRHTRKSSEQSIAESSEKADSENMQQKSSQGSSPKSDTGRFPLSARSKEIEDFFNSETQNSDLGRCMKFGSQHSDNSDNEYEHESDRDTEGMHREPSHRSEGVEDSTIDLKHRQTCSEGGNSVKNVPNFFMPVQHLEESMRTLQIVTNKLPDPQQQREKAEVASEMVARLTAQDRFSQVGTKGRLPTAEEAKRIAKIFSSKFS